MLGTCATFSATAPLTRTEKGGARRGGAKVFLNNSFCSQVPILRPGIFTLCTIFGKMPEFEPELLQPQPGVLPMSYTHPVAVNGAKEKKMARGQWREKNGANSQRNLN